MTNEELVEMLSDLMADAEEEIEQASRDYEDTNHPRVKTIARRRISFNKGRYQCAYELAKRSYLLGEVLHAVLLKSAANMA